MIQTRLWTSLLLCGLHLLGGCATSPKMTTQLEAKRFPEGEPTSYALLPPENAQETSPVAFEEVAAWLHSNFAQAGYQQSDDPELWIRVEYDAAVPETVKHRFSVPIYGLGVPFHGPSRRRGPNNSPYFDPNHPWGPYNPNNPYANADPYDPYNPYNAGTPTYRYLGQQQREKTSVRYVNAISLSAHTASIDPLWTVASAGWGSLGEEYEETRACMQALAKLVVTNAGKAKRFDTVLRPLEK